MGGINKRTERIGGKSTPEIDGSTETTSWITDDGDV